MRAAGLIIKAMLLVSIAINYSTTSAAAAAVSQQTNVPTVIWYIPHPDDETLGMAGAIIRSIKAGNRNIFLFLTRGGSTLVRLAGQPGPGGDIRIGDVKAARMREAREALLALGATSQNILFFDFPDGGLTLQQALGVVEQYREKYPNAAHRTVSIHDPHPDHQALATALATVNSANKGKLDVAYYRVYVFRQPVEQRLTQSVLAVRLSDADRKIKQKAITAYRTYDPTLGLYAIGERSVHDLLEAASADPYEYRDAMPVPYSDITVQAKLEDASSLLAGVVVASTASIWRVEINGEANINPYVSLRLDYRVHNLPAFGRLYIGGEIRFLTNTNSTSALIGASAMDSVYAEYHYPLGDGRPQLHWGLRFNWL